MYLLYEYAVLKVLWIKNGFNVKCFGLLENRYLIHYYYYVKLMQKSQSHITACIHYQHNHAYIQQLKPVFFSINKCKKKLCLPVLNFIGIFR